MSLIGKVALVTGASSGIGAAIALKFISEGAKVAIVGRNVSKLKNVSAKCEELGNEHLPIIGDVTDDDNVKRIVDVTLTKYGQLDVLVNNAGIGGFASILAPNALKIYDSVMSVNIRSLVSLTNLAAPHLIKAKGNIINISSVSGVRPYVSTGFAYNVSKAAVNHFTSTIAGELARSGVRVNVVNPGPVYTDIIKNIGLKEDDEAKLWQTMKKGTALDKIADAEEVAELVLFLASNKARSITGSSFLIDNGTVVKS